MSLRLSTVILLWCAYSLHAQIAGEQRAASSETPVYKIPDDGAIAIIKQQALSAQFEFHYQQAVSQGELRTVFEHLEAPAVSYGIGGEGSYYFDPIPLAIGAEVSVLFNGADSKTLGSSDFFSTKYVVSSSNMQVPILAHVRFQPNIESWLFPYAEAVGGLTVYSSTVSMKRIRLGDTTSTSDGDGDVCWNYGIGAGVAIKVADVITLPNTLQRTLIDIRFRYLLGTKTTIRNAQLDGGDGLGYSIIPEDVTKPEVVTFRLGVIFQF